MTGPNTNEWDWAKPKSVAPSPGPSPASSPASVKGEWDWTSSTPQSSSSSPKSEPKQEGFIDYLSNFVSSYMLTNGTRDKMKMEDMHLPVSYSPEEQAVKTQLVKAQSVHASAIATHDFVNFFGQMFKDAGSELKKVVQNPGETITAIKKDPVGTVGAFGKAFTTPLVELAELDSGIHLTGDDFSALTPVEKAERIKGAVATGAMMATGAAAGKAIKAGFTAIDALDGVAQTGLSVSRLVPKGELARKALKGTAEAAASGTSYGLVKHANEPDQLSETLINGVVFAPLGAAFELLHEKEAETQAPQKTAHQLSELRQVQADDQSFKGILNTVDAMTSADDVAEAIVHSKIAQKEPFIHLTGMDMGAPGSLAMKIPDDYAMAHSLHNDGTSNVLIYDKKYEPFVDKKFFAENGVAENQVVSHNGNSGYVVTGGDGRTLDLTNQFDPSDKLTIPRDQLRVPTRFQLNVSASSEVYDAWKKEAFVKPPTVLDQLQAKRTQLAGKSSPELDQVEDQLKRLEAKTNKTDPFAFNESPSSLLEETDGKDLSKHIDSFLEKQGVDPAFRDSYRKQLESRLRNEAIETLPPEDQKLIEQSYVEKSASSLFDVLHPPKKEIPQISVERLTQKAKSNNMTISDGGSGRVIVRDLQSKRILAGFDNNNAASAFIDKTGQASGVNMDGGGPISGDAMNGGRGLPPQDDVNGNDFPYKYNPEGGGSKWEYLIRGLDNSAAITRVRDWSSLLDTKYDTKFYSGVIEPLQRVLAARNANMTPWIKEGASVEKLIGKLPDADREKVGEWLQTMSPQQVINGFMSRPMNSLEQALGKQVAESHVDLERVFPYIREVEKLDDEFKENKTPEGQRDYANLVQQAREAYGIGDKEMAVVGTFNTITGMNKNDASLGAIVRLARSITDGELDRDAFAKRHKLTPAQLEAGKQLESLYSRSADHFGIPQASRLGGYMTHARLYTDGDISAAMKHFSGDAKTKDFYAKLSRTGEISAFEKDPIRAYYRYMKAGFDQQSGFSETLAKSRNLADKEIQKLPGLAQNKVAETVDHFMDDVRGFPAASDNFAQAALNHYMDTFGLDKDVNLRSQIVNTILSTFNAAMIGGRPIIGLAHAVTSGMIMPISDRGIGYTNRVWRSGIAARFHPEIMEAVRKDGGVSTISPIWQYSKAQFDQRAAVSRTLSKGAMLTSEALFKLTGLPDIFETLSAGHFLTSKADALNAITKFGRDEMTWNQLKKATYLDKFYDPIKKQFETLVKAGKTEEAANLLGRETVQDMIGIFGDASQPHWMGTNAGRVLGQYGNFPMWLRSTLTRGVSRGTVAQRIAFAAKFGAMAFGSAAVGRQIGIDLGKFNPLNALGWTGGTLASLAIDAGTAIKGSGYAQAQAKRRLQRTLPIDPKTGRLQPSIFVPGSYAIDGLARAAQDFSQGNTGRGIGDALGFHKYSIRQ